MSVKSILALGLIVMVGAFVYVGPEQMREALSGVHLFVEEFDVAETRAGLLEKKDTLTTQMAQLQADLIEKKEAGEAKIEQTVEAINELQRALAGIQESLQQLESSATKLKSSVTEF